MVLRRIQASDDGRARRGAEGIVAISAIKANAFAREPIEVRGLNARIDATEGGVVLLVACNQQDVERCVHGRCFSRRWARQLGRWRIFPMEMAIAFHRASPKPSSLGLWVIHGRICR